MRAFVTRHQTWFFTIDEEEDLEGVAWVVIEGIDPDTGDVEVGSIPEPQPTLTLVS